MASVGAWLVFGIEPLVVIGLVLLGFGLFIIILFLNSIFGRSGRRERQEYEESKKRLKEALDRVKTSYGKLTNEERDVLHKDPIGAFASAMGISAPNTKIITVG